MAKNAKKIKIIVILGSVRPGNMTGKVVGLVIDEIKKHKNVGVEVIDPSKLQLHANGKSTDADVKKLQKCVSAATGVILSTPEYHGSYSATIKLVIDNLGYPSTLSGKPVALLGVASGQIGAIKALEHLRSVCSHIGSVVLPGVVSVAGVHKLFDEQGHCLSEKIEQRIRSLPNNLLEYIRRHICPLETLEEAVREG